MYHYVYKVTHKETGQYYIGSRSCSVLPSQDLYLGSMCTWKPDKTKLIKEILFDSFESRAAAIEKEIAIIQSCIDDKLNENYSVPGLSFHTAGHIVVKDKEGKTFLIKTDDPRYVSGELLFVRAKQMPVKDKDGNTYSVYSDDPRVKSGEFVSTAKGLVTVKDSEGNNISVAKTDVRYLSGELVSMHKGLISVKDNNGNVFKVSKDDKRFLSGELVGIKKGSSHSIETKEKQRMKSLLHKGELSANGGKIWIHNLDTKKNALIKKGDDIPDGWTIGRKFF